MGHLCAKFVIYEELQFMKKTKSHATCLAWLVNTSLNCPLILPGHTGCITPQTCICQYFCKFLNLNNRISKFCEFFQIKISMYQHLHYLYKFTQMYNYHAKVNGYENGYSKMTLGCRTPYDFVIIRCDHG